MRCCLLMLFCCLAIAVRAQKLEFATFLIPDSLKLNANAVVRVDEISIAIKSQRNMTITQRRVVTVLNEYGQSSMDAFEQYDKSVSVKSIEATILDAVGNEIKKIKRKDFRDQSLVDNATIFSDNRRIFLDYTPTQYPYTIIFESVIDNPNTAFIPQWMPANDFFQSVQKSVLNVSYPPDLGFRKKEMNFAGYDIKSTFSDSQASYTAVNIPALKPEEYSLQLRSIFPRVMMGLESFHLEGVDGKAANWTEFGNWYNDKILTGTNSLSDESKAKIRSLVGSETDPIKKARIVYDYVQQKSRYVSIQAGIGGWKPMSAQDVDRLGYGDCKALSNYTRALLEAVGVPAYNTILYGDSRKTSIDPDFVSIQGNHMILCIPTADKYVWLECTSQTDPFGYQGTFTDDRDVLVIKENGAEIAHTTQYAAVGNTQNSKGAFSLLANGSLEGNVTIVSQGTQYAQKEGIERLAPVEKDAHYKEYWSSIDNLKINKLSFTNNREKVSFVENAAISAADYGKIAANRMMFPINICNRFVLNIRKLKNRRTPFEIQRGFVDTDEIALQIPAGFAIEAMPSPVKLQTKFGEYSAEVVKGDAVSFIYKRRLQINKGNYESGEYEAYRQFIEQISRNDNAKIVLIKHQ